MPKFLFFKKDTLTKEECKLAIIIACDMNKGKLIGGAEVRDCINENSIFTAKKFETETMFDAFSELVAEGKIKFVRLSNKEVKYCLDR